MNSDVSRSLGEQPGSTSDRLPLAYRTARTIAWLALAALLEACGPLRAIGLLPTPPVSAPDPPMTYDLTVALTAAPDINPDPSGRASPLRLHIHADKRDPQLDEHGFEAVFGSGPSGSVSASGSLSTPLLTLIVAPGESTELALTPLAGHTWVTIAAAYREPWSSVWVDSVRVDGKNESAVKLMLERTMLRLMKETDS